MDLQSLIYLLTAHDIENMILTLYEQQFVENLPRIFICKPPTSVVFW